MNKFLFINYLYSTIFIIHTVAYIIYTDWIEYSGKFSKIKLKNKDKKNKNVFIEWTAFFVYNLNILILTFSTKSKDWFTYLKYNSNNI